MPHNHTRCVQTALEDAESICIENGVNFTPIRRKVLEVVWNSHKAMKAYDIMDILSSKDRTIKPPTVYRALDFLLEQQLIHKVECLNAFVGCKHPSKNHACQMLICEKCGLINEACDDLLFKHIKQEAEKEGFQVKKHTLEVIGLCKDCQ